MDASATPTPEDLTPGIESGVESTRDTAREDIAVPLLPEGEERDPVLGNVKISLLIRKNPDVNFDDWLNSYATNETQDEMREALMKAGSNTANIDKFLAELRSPHVLDSVAYIELKSLVDKVNERQTAYEAASEEADEFKRGIIFDNVKGFFQRELVEGMQNEPIWTLAKAGVAIFLVYKLYNSFIADNEDAKKWFWGSIGVAAGAYLLNGYVEDDKGRTLLEMIGLTPNIESEELEWFFQEAGISESRERTTMMMRLTDVKIDKLADLYTDGDGEIDIDELIDDPSLTDAEAEELDKMNTPKMRKSLYNTIGKLIELAGVDSPLELKQKFRGETLLSVIFQLARVDQDRSSLSDSITEADSRLASVLSRIGVIEGVVMSVSEERLWMNGYPFAYTMEGDVLKIKDPADPSKQIAQFGTSDPERLRIGLESLYTTRYNVKEKITAQFKGVYAPSILGLGFEYNEATGQWKVKGFKVPAMPPLGIFAEMDIELEINLTAKGRIVVTPAGGKAEISPEDLENQVVHAALIKRLKEDGPAFCRAKKIDVKEHDEAAGRIKAVVNGTPVTMTYKDGKYNLIEADWDKGRLIEYFAGGIATKSELVLAEGLKPLRYNDSELFAGYNLIKNRLGTDLDEYAEFRTLYRNKHTEMGLLLVGVIRGLDQDGSDLAAKIEAEEQKLLDKLSDRLSDIAQRFNEFKTNPSSKQVTEDEFEDLYIVPFELAGIPNSYYAGEVKKLSDRLKAADYAGPDKLGPVYYIVRAQAFEYFYRETGYLATRDGEPSADDKARVAAAYQRIDEALNASEEHGRFFDNTVWVGEFETLMSEEHAPSYSNRPGPLTPPEASSVQPIGSLEINETNLDNKENAYAEYERYVTAYFDAAKELVPYEATDPTSPEARMAIQWETLVGMKKAEQIASFDKSAFEAQYTAAANPAEFAKGYIQGSTDKMVATIREIESIATTGRFTEATYLDMAAKLLFLDGDMYSGTTEDPTLTTRASSLESQLAAEYSANGNSSKYQRLLADFRKISAKDSFSGRREAYENYLHGTLLTSMYDASLTTREDFVAACTSRLGGIDAYTGSAWDKSDAALNGEVHEFMSSLDEVSAPYDVSEFMVDVYKEAVSSIHNGPATDIYIKSKQLEAVLDMHGDFFTAKEEFWTRVDEIGLNTEVKADVIELEQQLHGVIGNLEDGGQRVSNSNKTILYKYALNFVATELETEEDKDISLKELRRSIISKGRDLGLTLDKDDVSIV